MLISRQMEITNSSNGWTRKLLKKKKIAKSLEIKSIAGSEKCVK